MYGQVFSPKVLASASSRGFPLWLAGARVKLAPEPHILHGVDVGLLVVAGGSDQALAVAGLQSFLSVESEAHGGGKAQRSHANTRVKAGAAISALGRTHAPLADSHEVPRRDPRPVTVWGAIPLEMEEDGGDHIHVVVRPAATHKQRGGIRKFAAVASVAAPAAHHPRRAALIATIKTGESGCARCAFNCLEQAADHRIRLLRPALEGMSLERAPGDRELRLTRADGVDWLMSAFLKAGRVEDVRWAIDSLIAA
jgi:hypothetical protein